ncbi:nicotinate-nucleotide adenylyltransferase [Curvibacter sp. APW13]|uniref:nicotinate-nucleotide adenylyltransferase n=1 Tax=Curvibacter sp. APW13 TaxID=3077236 RepID=UPI0028DFEF95|nr:nicotinate-nucleotide adenylyltransferase [Curvibacter sp. APW13]MDT8991549.1 nicotinate-nucleotide adenylyltransferase [Curvibacter sp. APW13]
MTSLGTTGLRRIGVFGGAFDPPHAGHLRLAATALDTLKLDELRVIPTGQAWHKERALSAPEHRLAMAQLAFSSLPKVCVDARELRRSGPSYTVETLRELHAEQPGATFFLILGQDQWSRFGTWRQADEVARLAIICVAVRAELTGNEGQIGLMNPPPMALPMSALDVSSTEIRRAAALGQPLDGLVTARIARYIEQHHLYRNA